MGARFPYDRRYSPAAPTLEIKLSAPGEEPKTETLTALIDTGADGTLIPETYLETAEAIAVGSALLTGILGETRQVTCYEVDIHLANRVFPSAVVVANEYSHEIILGRNLLNKMILLLNGPNNESELFERRPHISRTG
ncbi:MAG: hypothetical protein AB1894_16050 [Chloroflexota bacterium]